MSRDDDPAALRWIKSQAAKGATLIGICAGAKVLAAAGLLDDKRATTHWYYLKEMLEEHPRIRPVIDRRIVVDGNIATTTGITASMPMMLTLIEAIAGQQRARDVAQHLGVTSWDARHDSSAFRFTRRFALTVLGNTLAFWRRDQVEIELYPGIDEVSLALIADAWSKTYRSDALTFAPADRAVETRSGMRLLPDHVAIGPAKSRLVPAIGQQRPAEALDQTLRTIAGTYGVATAEVVATLLEYPQRDGDSARGVRELRSDRSATEPERGAE